MGPETEIGSQEINHTDKCINTHALAFATAGGYKKFTTVEQKTQMQTHKTKPTTSITLSFIVKVENPFSCSALCEIIVWESVWFRWCHSAVRTPWEVTGPDGYFIQLPWHPASDLWVFTGLAQRGHCQERCQAHRESAWHHFPLKRHILPLLLAGETEREKGRLAVRPKLRDRHTSISEWAVSTFSWCPRRVIMIDPTSVCIQASGSGNDTAQTETLCCQITAIVSLINSLSISRVRILNWNGHVTQEVELESELD